jgi:mRNA interferase MazF
MKRGDMYLLRRPGGGDTKKQRVMTVVSRQALVDSRFPTVICAPVFTRGHGLETEVSVGPEEGLKHPSWIGCDGLVSIPKSRLTDYVGALPASKLPLLSRALGAALDLF